MSVQRLVAIAAFVCAAAGIGFAAGRPARSPVRIVRVAPGPVSAAGELIKTGLEGTITVAVPLDPRLSSMTCSDLAVHIGKWQTPPPVPGESINLAVFHEVRAGTASGVISSGKCTYKVTGVPSATPYSIYLDAAYPKFSPAACAGVSLNTQPVNPAMTFSSGHMVTLNFQVRPECILPPA